MATDRFHRIKTKGRENVFLPFTVFLQYQTRTNAEISAGVNKTQWTNLPFTFGE
jgi:hypothetical protein